MTDFDENDALERTAGDRNILVDVIRFTLEDIPEILNEIDSALNDGMWQGAALLAHKAKGTAGAAGARRLFLASLDLELAAKDESEECKKLLTVMTEAFESFRSHPGVLKLSSLDAGGIASIG